MALALLTSLHKSEQTAGRKQKRGSFEEFPVGSYAEGIGVPLQKTSQFTSGVDHYLPFSAVDTGNVKVDVDLPPFRPQYQQQNVAVTASADHVPQILSNSIDKPVQEPQVTNNNGSLLIFNELYLTSSNLCNSFTFKFNYINEFL